MSRTDELNKLKLRADEMRQGADRAQGRLDSSMASLKDEFGLTNVEDAEKLLKELEAEETEAKEAFDGALEEFKDEWGDQL